MFVLIEKERGDLVPAVMCPVLNVKVVGHTGYRTLHFQQGVVIGTI